MRKLLITTLSLCLLMAFGISNSYAIVISGSVTQIAPPVSVVEGAIQSDTEVRLFQEVQNHTLSADVNVDITTPGYYNNLGGGTLTVGDIAAGTIVNSYFLHHDVIANSVRLDGQITFDMDILGVIASTARLNNSDALLGHVGTIYPTGVNGRGTLDSNDLDFIDLSADRRTISFSMGVLNWSLDSFRVVTSAHAVPEPPIVLLMGLGLLIFGATRRKAYV